MFLAVMLGVIALAVIVSLPSLLTKKCAHCGARNALDTRVCRKCQAAFADDLER